MNLDSTSLSEFEAARKINKFIPPNQSNSFYNIGDGKINLYCARSDPALFDLYLEGGSTTTGPDAFRIAGDIRDSNNPYRSLTMKAGTSLSITNALYVNSGTAEIHGDIRLNSNCMLVVNNEAEMTFYTDSTFIVDAQTQIVVEKGAILRIYGEVYIDLAVINLILDNPGIYIDSAAHLNVQNINIQGRAYSLTDYEMELRSKVINPHTQGDKAYGTGRIGYTWKNGTPVNGSQCIELSVLWGQAILGDYKLSLLGKQEKVIENHQLVESLSVKEGASLYIADKYQDKTYLDPELYIGIVIGNSTSPGFATIDGSVYVNGSSAKITIDRGSKLIINETGSVYVENGGAIQSRYNEETVALIINGTLTIEDIEQLDGFDPHNIEFGENGKLIILNPERREYRTLLSMPNGVKYSELYRLFGERLDHIEYHVSNNTGIRVDEYHEFYSRDMPEWYNGMRIEKAIYDGLIVWHNGGVMELDQQIIPWVSLKCSLLESSRLFKSSHIEDELKLEEVAAHLRYAGCGNMTFRFIADNTYKEVTLHLEDVQMTNVVNKPMSDAYILSVTNTGRLFLHNSVTTPDEVNIINETALTFPLYKGDNEVLIP